MRKIHWKNVVSAVLLSACCHGFAWAQSSDVALVVPSGLRSLDRAQLQSAQFLSYAHFSIPFDVDRNGALPREIRLWVSPDAGMSWMMYGRAAAQDRSFEFHAAREGEYLFAVQAIDARGGESLGGSPPMRIVIDTSKPQLQLAADIDAEGKLVVDYQAIDSHLDPNSLKLSYSVDGSQKWPSIALSDFQQTESGMRGRAEVALPHCHEIELRLSAADYAQNLSETSTRYTMPRTASTGQALQLANHRGEGKGKSSNGPSLHTPVPTGRVPAGRTLPGSGIVFGAAPAPGNLQASAATGLASSAEQQKLQSTNGGVPWLPQSSRATLSTPKESETQQITESRLTNWNAMGPELASSESSKSTKDQAGADSLQLEELPAPISNASPTPSDSPELVTKTLPEQEPALQQEAASNTGTQRLVEDGANRVSHCRSRSFSLDYSIESLNGAAVSGIELWGTEDNGKSWQKWGADPDRESPFDVQVGDDGLFGFRMVVIGTNGLIGNRPNDGDSADMWIQIDTERPTVRISRALYGEGADAGTLVIDYLCKDENLHERPIKLSYSEKPVGPWITIASGLANTGLYLWRADPQIPKLVYLKLEAVDSAGNIAEHRLELPVDLRGLAPRGRIQGIRPIDAP